MADIGSTLDFSGVFGRLKKLYNKEQGYGACDYFLFHVVLVEVIERKPV